jgi:hypothetical protein
MITDFHNSMIETVRPMRTEMQVGFHVAPDNERKCANGAVHLTTMPSALLSQILRTQDLRQKRVLAGDSGRWAKKYCASVMPLLHFSHDDVDRS